MIGLCSAEPCKPISITQWGKPLSNQLSNTKKQSRKPTIRITRLFPRISRTQKVTENGVNMEATFETDDGCKGNHTSVEGQERDNLL